MKIELTRGPDGPRRVVAANQRVQLEDDSWICSSVIGQNQITRYNRFISTLSCIKIKVYFNE